jgi:hypothetical protein
MDLYTRLNTGKNSPSSNYKFVGLIVTLHVHKPMYKAKHCSITVSTLEPHTVGARFAPLTCSSLMVPSGGKIDVKLGFSFSFNGRASR